MFVLDFFLIPHYIVKLSMVNTKPARPQKAPVGVRLHSPFLKTVVSLYWLLLASMAPISKNPGDPVPNTQPAPLPTGLL